MHDIRFYEDHARIRIIDNQQRNTLFHNLLAVNIFEEVVLGMDELYIKFDPLTHDEANIANIIASQNTQQSRLTNKTKQHHLPLDFITALDMELICNLMDMDQDQFQCWFVQQNFTVDMMGFQPGFAYLSHDNDAPKIERLDKPRAKIAAGSIGFLGETACIYAHDGPGGWPIIGSIHTPIFNHSHNPPNLLQSGDTVIFEPI